MLNIKRVALGISGGVDSAVAALLLKNRGYDVKGVFMQNWDIADEKGHCAADADFKDASFICEKLKIELNRVNFVKEYWNEVFCELIKEYESGNTPNPDILCNRNIKFNYFLKYALNTLGADAIATGHYAKSSFGPYLENYDPAVGARLYCAKDVSKDQTFFLSQIKQEALQRTMFPLGDLLKSEVKEIALKNGLEKIARKKESMGICFIGNRRFQDFIKEYVQDKPGDFIDADTLKVLGSHNGIHQWTLGQRARIGSLLSRHFIARKDVQKSTIYVVNNTQHPLLYTNLIFTCPPSWIHSQPEELRQGNVLECEFKFQHTKLWVPSLIFQTDKGLVIKVEKFKRAITPGQYAVLSKDGECLGGAKIANGGVSYFSLFYFKDKGKGGICENEELTDNENIKIAM